MSKKKLTKRIWYSSDIDNTGQPIIPPLAKNSDDLDGLHEGELFLHNSDEQPNIWIRTIGGRIVPLFKGGGGTADSISWINITDKPAWLVDGIIDYSEVVGTPDLSIYAKKSYVDSTFVTLSGNEDVSGIKNFTNGIKLSGIEFKYDSENNAVCLQKTDGTPINFYVTGGLSMYGQGNTSVKSIMDAIAANLDKNTLDIQNGLLTVVGGIGGVDEDAVRTLIESYDYATKDFVRDYVLQNATGGEFELSKQMVIEALGFTPYSAENPNGYITAASIPSALKNPYALTFGSKTYDGSAAKEITASDLGAALSSDLSKYLPLTGGTVNGIIYLNHTLNQNSRISFKNNRTEESSSWAVNIMNATDVSSNVMMRFGIYGTAKVLDYIFLGHNTYTGNNLRIYTDKVTFGENTIWHAGNFNPADYLPLSGGQMTGSITMGTNKYLYGVQEGSGAMIYFDGKRTVVGSVGASTTEGTHVRSKTGHLTVGTTASSGHTVWDSGNDGSESGLDADLLDGKHNGELTSLYVKQQAATTDDFATYLTTYGKQGLSVVVNGSGAAIGNIGSTDTVVNFGHAESRLGRLLFTRANNSQNLFWQTANASYNGWGTKRQIAFIDSNVASATSAGSADIATEAKCIVSTKAYNTLTENYNKWQRIAKITLSGQYANGTFSAIFYVGEAMTDQAYATLFKVYLHAYQQNAMGNAPYVKLTWDNSNAYHHIAAIVNYNSSASTIELYAKSDAAYCNMYVKVLGGLNWLNISQTNHTNIPSGTRVNPVTEVLAASAAKLTTARTIWGQSFDGTADVTGILKMPNNNTLRWLNNAGAEITCMYLSNENKFFIGNGVAENGYDTYLSGKNLIFRYGTSRTEGVRIDSSGNVGIGTTSPSAKFHVNGISYLGGATTIGGNLVPSASNTYALGASNNNWSYIYTTGIRRWDGSTANETPLLHGESNNTNITLLRVSYASSSYFAQTGAYGFTLKYFGVGGGNANYLKLLADNQTASSQVLALCVDQAGNIGVGCDTNEDYKLRVNGTGYFSSNLLVAGGVTMQSQRSLKNVVDERGLSLTELSAIKPTRYTWKDKRDDRLHFGGIADDIERVLPEVIYKSEDGTLTMDYGNAGFAIASSLIKPVIDHEERIKALEKENELLKQELKRYSA